MTDHRTADPAAADPTDAGAPGDAQMALFADLYQLTMARAYFELGLTAPGVFSLFIRKQTPTRRYFLACGLEAALRDLEAIRFEKPALDYLATLDGRFPDPFLRWLEDFRFSGSIRAVAEGTPVFAHEPLLEVTAPLPEGQLIETMVMNRVALETMLASKGARVVAAAQGRTVADFGCRRAHGVDSALRGARAFYIAGVDGTSNVLAGSRYGIPVYGTVAHSFIEAHESEEAAFEAFASIFPGTTLLVDTYDTPRGVDRLIALANRLGDAFDVAAIRLDSGDLGALSRVARDKLDAAGLKQVKIFVSGGLDEDRLDALLQTGAPIDGFGVGTEMSVSRDAPALDIVYKLTTYDGRGRMKLAPGKRTLPGPKQVFRRFENGVAVGDEIARADETRPGEPLLHDVMRDGRTIEGAIRSTAESRAFAASTIARMPPSVRTLEAIDDGGDAHYPVAISVVLEADEARLKSELSANNPLN